MLEQTLKKRKNKEAAPYAAAEWLANLKTRGFGNNAFSKNFGFLQVQALQRFAEERCKIIRLVHVL